jgi:hypothetical protein
MSLVEGMSPTCPTGADNVEDHISNTLGRQGKSLRNWSPLQRIAREFGFRILRFRLVDFINTPSTIKNSWLLISNVT